MFEIKGAYETAAVQLPDPSYVESSALDLISIRPVYNLKG